MPRKAVNSSAKRVPLNMRATPELRAKLEASAGDSGRSLAQEVEFRLEQAFQYEKIVGDHDALMQRLHDERAETLRTALFRAGWQTLVTDRGRCYFDPDDAPPLPRDGIHSSGFIDPAADSGPWKRVATAVKETAAPAPTIDHRQLVDAMKEALREVLGGVSAPKNGDGD